MIRKLENIQKALKTTLVLLVGVAIGTLLTGYLILLEVSKLSCDVRMSLGDSLLVVEAKSPEYKVYLNGSQVWPRGGSWLAAVPLEGRAAEVRVERGSESDALYAVRLPNGTYLFTWDGKTAKSVCTSWPGNAAS